MWQIKPRKHGLGRRNHRVARYPFSKMIINDFFEDSVEFAMAIRASATKANRRLTPRKFSVKILNDKVICIRVA